MNNSTLNNVSDPTEAARREMTASVNSVEGGRADLEKRYGKVWNTSELGQEFEVKGFMAPFVVVKRKSDGQVGSLTFQHNPRFYFDFAEDS